MRKIQVALGAGVAVLGALSVFAVTTAQAAPASPEASPSVSRSEKAPATGAVTYSAAEYTVTDTKIVSKLWSLKGDDQLNRTIRAFPYDAKTQFCFYDENNKDKCEPATSKWSRDVLNRAAHIYLEVNGEGHTDRITVGGI
jgi:hypothetical protein